MEIIPAIDMIDGKCVRLSQGNYRQCKIYAHSPLEVAKAFEAAGIRRLHLVDLDGAKGTGIVNLRHLEAICSHTSLSVDFGGGIKSETDLRSVLEAGADYACLGSIAQTAPEVVTAWLERYGGERLIIGADVWNTKICIQGWKKVTDTTIYELVEAYKGRLQHLMCTDITRDGMLSGISEAFYEDLVRRYPDVKVIASGGIGSMEDIRRIAGTGVCGVVVGKAIYEKKVRLEEIAGFGR